MGDATADAKQGHGHEGPTDGQKKVLGILMEAPYFS